MSHRIIRQGDECYCAHCGLRWNTDEVEPDAPCAPPGAAPGGKPAIVKLAAYLRNQVGVPTRHK